MGMLSVVIPPTADQTNLVTNPSAELVVTGYSGVTNTPARQATYQRRGAWGVSYVMASGTTDGLYWGTVSLTSGTTYTFSCDVRGALGIPYKIYFGTTGGTLKGTATTFTGTGDWQRVTVSWAADSTTTFRLYVSKNSSSDTSTIYVDGFLCVAASSDQLYWDGDSRGFRDGDYYWTGTPHSSTSVIRAGTRAGGTAVDFSTYGFYITQIVGLGLAGLMNVITPTPLIGGGVYQRTISAPRTFALVGTIKGSGLQAFQQNRKALINALKSDAAPTQQPVLLRFQGSASGSNFGDVLDVPAIYEGGLDGGEMRGYTEQTALKFSAHMPYIAVEEGHEGVSLGYQTSIASANRIITRNSLGAWSLLGTGANALVYAIAVGPDGSVYAGGMFTSMGGVANTLGIARWDGSAWNAMGTGSNDIVRTIAVGPDGSVYAGGLFTSMGGVANTAYIAKWNGSAWSAMGTGANQNVRSIAVGSDGSVYAGGSFTSMGGVANTTGIAKWNGSAWSAMGTGVNTYAYAVAIGIDGSVYVGGAFTSAGGVSNTAYVAKWSGSAWVAMGTGADSYVYSIAVGLDGSVYVGGAFASAGGAPNTACIARWNGAAWSALGTGASSTVNELSIDKSGRLYAVGAFSNMGGLSLLDSLAIWNGSSWVYPMVDLPGSYTVQAVYARSPNNIYVGWTDTGTATVETVTTVTNGGTTNASPTLVITGPGRVYGMTNYTTGDNVYFNLALNSGEKAYLDLTPGAIRFYSNFRPNLLNTIMAGSNLATFRLTPGANSISLFIAGTTDANTAAWMYWRKPHHSVDGGSN